MTQGICRHVIQILDSSLHAELRAQGHRNTGALENSIYGRLFPIQNGYQIRGYALHYAGILNDGVSPERIPFQFTGKGGESKYINGLIIYFRSKGLSQKEAKSAAFATAIKHKKEGMSTKASQRFSSTGFRKGFIEIVEHKTLPAVERSMILEFDRLVTQKLTKIKSEII